MWPPEALEFLRELEANNDRDWFKANRQRYDEYLVAPARALAEQLSHLGEPHLFRPYNNLRFRPGPPLKEHLGVAIGYGSAGSYYFDVSLDGLLVGGGLFHPAPDQLERFRAAINDGRKAGGFERAVSTAQEAGLSMIEPALKRAPRGYPADHPRLERLRLKQFTAYRRYPVRRWLHLPECDERVKSGLEATRPLVSWLGKNVGPSTRERR
ncbi:MAG: DUF2461 domain-containing protein [Solirubrobacteraceae bacterium]